MNQKIAIKRLTASDLTFFKWHFQNRNAGNQKAINLNADVFVHRLYPSIEAAARATDSKLPLDLWIYGPGEAKPLNLQRKIVKGGAYKNWRLNGEFISNPIDEPNRFNVLEPNDFAVIAFEGEIVPVSATIIFVARNAPSDARLHGELAPLIHGSMAELDERAIEGLVERAEVAPNHPLAWLSLSAELTEAAVGSAKATARILRRGGGIRLSQAELRRAREAAEETGRIGEQMVNEYLDSLRAAGKISDFEWTSEANAVAPYDFQVKSSDTTERIDVKSTSGSFERDIHVSLSELQEMASGDGPYRIYRVYQLNDEGGQMRVSEDMRRRAQEILDSFRALPEGVAVDNLSIDPTRIPFGEPITIAVPPEEEGVNPACPT